MGNAEAEPEYHKLKGLLETLSRRVCPKSRGFRGLGSPRFCGLIRHIFENGVQ